jgi:predicted acylesterase/phospholipase RssA
MTRRAFRWLVALLLVSAAIATWYEKLRMPFFPRDVVSVALAALMSFVVGRSLRQFQNVHEGSPRYSSGWVTPISAATTFLLSAWLITSGADHVFSQRLLIRGHKPIAGPPAVRVGLALSGGGHRAALLHAGALFELEKLGVKVTNLSVVSGGSLIGAFYAFGGTPTTFLAAETAGQLSVRREAGHIESLLDFVRHGTTRGTTSIHSRVLDQRLLPVGTLREWAEYPGSLRLMIGATDLITGDLIGILPQGVLRCPIKTLQGRVAAALRPTAVRLATSQFLLPYLVGLNRHTRVSDLLAASSAIPGVFPAVAFQRESELERLQLVDGGVTDNTGLRLLLEADFQARRAANTSGTLDTSGDERRERLAAYEQLRYDALRDWAMDLIIASDGGFAFLRSTPPDVLEELGRSLSIMQANSNAAGLDRPDILSRYSGRVVLLTPDLLMPKVLGDSFLSRQSIKQQMAFTYQPTATNVANEMIPFASLTDPERLAIAEILPNKRRTEALSLLTEARSSGFDYAKRISPFSRTPGPGFAVFELVANDLASCLRTFTRVSTVTDRIDARDAHRLFRLGRYLVQLRRREIAAGLKNHSVNASSPNGELKEK